MLDCSCHRRMRTLAVLGVVSRRRAHPGPIAGVAGDAWSPGASSRSPSRSRRRRVPARTVQAPLVADLAAQADRPVPGCLGFLLGCGSHSARGRRRPGAPHWPHASGPRAAVCLGRRRRARAGALDPGRGRTTRGAPAAIAEPRIAAARLDRAMRQDRSVPMPSLPHNRARLARHRSRGFGTPRASPVELAAHGLT